MNTREIFEKLSEPFPASAIDWRVGATNKEGTKGLAFPYLQARPVMDRLDDVVGAENWKDEYVPIVGGFICKLSIRLSDEWITKEDAADTSDIEAIKGGVSDSFKRAAVKWGIGRYLYDINASWADIEKRGSSYVLKETPKLPAWALPGGDTAQAKPEQPKQAEAPEPKPKPEVHAKYQRPMQPEVLREALKVKAAKARPATEKQRNLLRVLLVEHFANKDDERYMVQEYLTGHKHFAEIEPEMVNAMLDWLKPDLNPDGSGSYVIDDDAKLELTLVVRQFMEDLGQEKLL